MTRRATSAGKSARSAGESAGGRATPSSAPYKTMVGGLDFGALGQLPLDRQEARFARRVPVPMAVGVNHHVDEIGIVEGRRGAVERLVAEVPGGRPGLPEQAAERAAIRSRPARPRSVLKYH